MSSSRSSVRCGLLLRVLAGSLSVAVLLPGTACKLRKITADPEGDAIASGDGELAADSQNAAVPESNPPQEKAEETPSREDSEDGTPMVSKPDNEALGSPVVPSDGGEVASRPEDGSHAADADSPIVPDGQNADGPEVGASEGKSTAGEDSASEKDSSPKEDVASKAKARVGDAAQAALSEVPTATKDSTQPPTELVSSDGETPDIASSTAEGALDTVAEKASEVVDDVAEKTSETAGAVLDAGESAVDTVAEKASELADTAIDSAGEAAGVVSASGQDETGLAEVASKEPSGLTGAVDGAASPSVNPPSDAEPSPEIDGAEALVGETEAAANAATEGARAAIDDAGEGVAEAADAAPGEPLSDKTMRSLAGDPGDPPEKTTSNSDSSSSAGLQTSVEQVEKVSANPAPTLEKASTIPQPAAALLEVETVDESASGWTTALWILVGIWAVAMIITFVGWRSRKGKA